MKKNEIHPVDNKLLSDVRQIIDTARANAIRSVDFSRVTMYWNLGRRIFEEEQQGKDRADYGARIIRGLAERLEPEYGSGFSYRQLAFSRQFYRTYPIVNALRSQLNWTQYRLLIQIDDELKREYYELESINHCWTARETERQIHSQLWERLCLSNDKEAVLTLARKERIPETPQEIIKDPMRLEFLGLEKKPHYYENDLEQAIIDHLQDFIMKLGNGFAPVPELLSSGVNVCLGTDGAASNNAQNLFREMSHLALIHKGTHKTPQCVGAGEVFYAATAAGAKALNLNTGSIEVGKKADLAILRLDLASMMPNNNLLAALCYSADGSETDTVIIDGKIVMQDRELKTIDEEKVFAKIREICHRLDL